MARIDGYLDSDFKPMLTVPRRYRILTQAELIQAFVCNDHVTKMAVGAEGACH